MFNKRGEVAGCLPDVRCRLLERKRKMTRHLEDLFGKRFIFGRGRNSDF
jgi:hypothetical protein